MQLKSSTKSGQYARYKVKVCSIVSWVQEVLGRNLLHVMACKCVT